MSDFGFRFLGALMGYAHGGWYLSGVSGGVASVMRRSRVPAQRLKRSNSCAVRIVSVRERIVWLPFR